jgi:hypothetical protein
MHAPELTGSDAEGRSTRSVDSRSISANATSTNTMNRRHTASLLAAFFLATGLAFLGTQVRAESPPPATATASVTATAVTALPTPVPPAASVDDFGNTGEYIVMGSVLGALAILAGVLVVLWFVID